MTKKILLLANRGLGDHVSSIVIAKNLSKGNYLHGIFSNLHGFNLIKQTPYLSSYSLLDVNIEFLPSGDVDFTKMKKKLSPIVEIFPLYEEVYVCRPGFLRSILKMFPINLQKNVVTPFANYNKNIFRPLAMANEFGFKTKDISLNIEWYKDYYHDFKCDKNSILLNCDSTYMNRTYIEKKSIKKELEKIGFDVREFDYSSDIRSNIHLIHQVEHIITTDTSTLWLAKALNKQPHVFLAANDLPIKKMEVILDVKNIISKKYKEINLIPPIEIVNGFLKTVLF